MIKKLLYALVLLPTFSAISMESIPTINQSLNSSFQCSSQDMQGLNPSFKNALQLYKNSNQSFQNLITVPFMNGGNYSVTSPSIVEPSILILANLYNFYMAGYIDQKSAFSHLILFSLLNICWADHIWTTWNAGSITSFITLCVYMVLYMDRWSSTLSQTVFITKEPEITAPLTHEDTGATTLAQGSSLVQGNIPSFLSIDEILSNKPETLTAQEKEKAVTAFMDHLSEELDTATLDSAREVIKNLNSLSPQDKDKAVDSFMAFLAEKLDTPNPASATSSSPRIPSPVIEDSSNTSAANSAHPGPINEPISFSLTNTVSTTSSCSTHPATNNSSSNHSPAISESASQKSPKEKKTLESNDSTIAHHPRVSLKEKKLPIPPPNTPVTSPLKKTGKTGKATEYPLSDTTIAALNFVLGSFLISTLHTSMESRQETPKKREKSNGSRPQSPISSPQKEKPGTSGGAHTASTL